MNNQTLEAKANTAGQAAFENGKKCVPAHDPNCLGLIEENGQALVILDAWIAGWTKANLDAPIDFPNDELCPQCEADDGDFYNGLAIGEICAECKAFNQMVDEALIETGDDLAGSIAWRIGKDRGYSNAAFALPKAVQIVKSQTRRSI